MKAVFPLDMVDAALEMFGRVATAFPKVKGIWRDDEKGETLGLLHADIENDRYFAGREARQGELGLVIGDEYFAIRDFGEGATT